MLNPYFNFRTATNEQAVVEKLNVQAIQIFGMDLLYAPKTLVDFNKLFGEDAQRAFKQYFTIEAYMENVEGFLGDKNFLNKMGLNIEKQAVFMFSKKRFNEIVSPGTQASLVIGNITLTALAIDSSGNSITITIQNSGANQSLFVHTVDGVITVTLATDSNGTVTTTESQLHQALVADYPASKLVTFTLQGPGTGLASPLSTTPLSGGIDPGVVRPNEGDIIYLPLTHDIFEISFADHEEVFYQLGKIYVWKITCEKFIFSHEVMDTGNSLIDSIAAELENDNSLENDPLADNDEISDKIENFLLDEGNGLN